MERNKELLKGKQEVSPNVFMKKADILAISLDDSLSPQEKKDLFKGVYKSKDALLKAKAKRIAEENKKLPKKPALTDKEVMDLDPIFIDERIEALKHLHPHDLLKNLND
jgi:hypothetical protein